MKLDVKRGPRNSGPCLPNEEIGTESSVGSQKNDSSCTSDGQKLDFSFRQVQVPQLVTILKETLFSKYLRTMSIYLLIPFRLLVELSKWPFLA